MRALWAPRARTLGLTVPVHLAAFAILYLATSRIVEHEVLEATSIAAQERLHNVVGQLYSTARSQTDQGGHPLEPLVEAHRTINFHLFVPGGEVLGAAEPLTRLEHDEMVGFLVGGAPERFWIDERDGRTLVRGLERVAAGRDCAPCHRPGTTLAAASMTMDLTPQVAGVEARSRRNLGLLIVAWAALVGVTTAVVKRSAKRSASLLDADLAAVDAGEGGGASGFVFDPVSAELHRSLREFLERRRRREAEVASRLQHTDRLASLGRLAAGLAHEIKNPLAGIQGALEILRDDVRENPSASDLCTQMLEELSRVNDTLQLLLASARPSTPRPVATDLPDFLGEIERLLEPGLRRRGVNLRFETAGGVSEAPFDPGQIRQVLVNLINNAGDAVEQGGTIVVRAGELPGRGGVILTVEDDGPGIPEENLKRIFEPFFTTKFSGTGLGLAISRSLVEQHGGSLEVESEPGRGARFYLLLPTPETPDSGAVPGEATVEAS